MVLGKFESLKSRPFPNFKLPNSEIKVCKYASLQDYYDWYCSKGAFRQIQKEKTKNETTLVNEKPMKFFGDAGQARQYIDQITLYRVLVQCLAAAPSPG